MDSAAGRGRSASCAATVLPERPSYRWVVGLAFRDCDMQAAVSQGAAPGQVMLITSGRERRPRARPGPSPSWIRCCRFHARRTRKSHDRRRGRRGGRARGRGPAYVVRQLLGFDRDASALAIGAAPDLKRGRPHPACLLPPTREMNCERRAAPLRRRGRRFDGALRGARPGAHGADGVESGAGSAFGAGRLTMARSGPSAGGRSCTFSMSGCAAQAAASLLWLMLLAHGVEQTHVSQTRGPSERRPSRAPQPSGLALGGAWASPAFSVPKFLLVSLAASFCSSVDFCHPDIIRNSRGRLATTQQQSHIRATHQRSHGTRNAPTPAKHQHQ